jgi:hypothetical protein
MTSFMLVCSSHSMAIRWFTHQLCLLLIMAEWSFSRRRC